MKLNKNQLIFFAILCFLCLVKFGESKRKRSGTQIECVNTTPINLPDYKYIYPGNFKFDKMKETLKKADQQITSATNLFKHPQIIGSIIIAKYSHFLLNFAIYSSSILNHNLHHGVVDKNYNRAIYGGVIDFQNELEKEVTEKHKNASEEEKKKIKAEKAIEYIETNMNKVLNKFSNENKPGVEEPTLSMIAFPLAFAGDVGGHIFDYVDRISQSVSVLPDDKTSLKNIEDMKLDQVVEAVFKNKDNTLSEKEKEDLKKKIIEVFDSKENITKFLFALMEYAYKLYIKKDPAAKFEKHFDSQENVKSEYFKKLLDIKKKMGGNELVRCLKKRQRGSGEKNVPFRCGLLQSLENPPSRTADKLCAKWPAQTLPKNMVKLNQEDRTENPINEPLAGHFSGTILENLHITDLIISDRANNFDDPFLWVEDSVDKTKLNTDFRKCKAAFSASILMAVGYHSACEVRPTIMAYLGEKTIDEARPLLQGETTSTHAAITQDADIIKPFVCHKDDTEYLSNLIRDCQRGQVSLTGLKKKNLKKIKK